MKTTWIIDGSEFKRMKKSYNKDAEGDCFGNILVGALSFDIVNYADDDGSMYLSGDCYVLYEDDGYGYTPENNIPYTSYGKGSVTLPAPDGMRLEEWKEKSLKVIMSTILDNEMLTLKANIDNACWD